jgi:hypothetical protein
MEWEVNHECSVGKELKGDGWRLLEVSEFKPGNWSNPRKFRLASDPASILSEYHLVKLIHI